MQGENAKSDATSRIRLPDFRDVTRELSDACRSLDNETLVHSEGFALLDSMGAIEVMEPRMDSGIFPVPHALVAECDRPPLSLLGEDHTTPPFDVTAKLSAEEMCWVMDRLLACEAAWHRGAPLSQTIFTCLYMHHLPLSRPISLAASLPTQASLLSCVLRPFLLGVLKSMHLVWDELVRDNVIDGEDYFGDKAGLHIAEDIPVGDVLDQLEEAIQWLDSGARDDETGKTAALSTTQLVALKHRLELRFFFLHSVALLAYGNTVRRLDASWVLGRQATQLQRSDDALSALPTVLDMLMGVNERFGSHPEGSPILQRLAYHKTGAYDAPSEKSRAAFDTNFARRLVSGSGRRVGIPPPAPVELPAPVEIYIFFKEYVAGLRAVHGMYREPSWRSWKNAMSVQALQFQSAPSTAFIRSTLHSLICSNNEAAFGKQPLTFLFKDMVQSATGYSIDRIKSGIVDAGTVEAARWVKERESRTSDVLPILESLEWFVARAAGQLSGVLGALAQNRSRGKRRLAKTYADWLPLSEEAAELGKKIRRALPADARAFHPEALSAACQLVSLDMMLHITLSGFELELYAPQERAYAHWVTLNIATEQHDILQSLKDDVSARRAARPADDCEILRRAALYLDQDLTTCERLQAASKGLFLLAIYMDHAGSARPATKAKTLQPHHARVSRRSDMAEENAEALRFATFEMRFKWMNVHRHAVHGRNEALNVRMQQSKAQMTQLWGVFLSDEASWHRTELREVLKCAADNFEVATAKSAPESVDILPLSDAFQQSCEENLAKCSSLLRDETHLTKAQPVVKDLIWVPSQHPWIPTLHIRPI
ncbi:Glucose-repressible protein and related proteins [Ceraceosorus bombacis]|uniref:Glucose-repressible protein and related proteins n=1 Tax=Ceraceosorus bombacis TaxID=401625 RepID=A0A0P1BAY0_9BASI|nr:Glucose-repressible protein and related proteins [Ceraceosorus bombacis]